MVGVILVALLSTVLHACGPGRSAKIFAVNGVVKSVSATTLVIARPGKVPAEMRFVIGTETQRQGPVAVGNRVQVRYRADGLAPTATAMVVTSSETRERVQ